MAPIAGRGVNGFTFLEPFQESSIRDVTSKGYSSLREKWVELEKMLSPSSYQELTVKRIPKVVTIADLLKSSLPLILIPCVLGIVELINDSIFDAIIAFSGAVLLSLMVLYAVLSKG